MTPLRLEFWLNSPMVAPERPLHLDALVAHAAFRSAERAEAPDPLAAIEELPLGELHSPAEQRGVWQASQLHLEQVGALYWDHYTRRHEISAWADAKEKGHWHGNKNKISLGTGPQKSYLLYQPLINVSRAVSWCIGDEDTLRVLLESEIHSLGRNGRAGFGRIAKIEIVPCPADEQEFWRRRSLPLDLDQYKLPGHFLCTANFRAPYWDRATWRTVWEYSAETQSASAEVPALSPMALASSAPLG